MIKRTGLDGAFSDVIRWSYDWRCQFLQPIDGRLIQCEKHWPETSGADAHCSHFISRKIHATRWFPDNAVLLCAPHHAEVTQRGYLNTELMLRILGEVRAAELKQRSYKIVRYRDHDKREMAKHYREETRRIMALRANGETGYIPIVPFD